MAIVLILISDNSFKTENYVLIPDQSIENLTTEQKLKLDFNLNHVAITLLYVTAKHNISLFTSILNRIVTDVICIFTTLENKCQI